MKRAEVQPVAVIPAHLASVRFPRKVLHLFHGLPMIEHVRRRASLVEGLGRVVVATCDEEVAQVVHSFGGDVIMTSNEHSNGTTRVAEAVASVDCSHVVLLQGDEPLLLPRHIEALLAAIRADPGGDAWNATGPIDTEDELDRHSFVKCAMTQDGRVLYCFRRSPGYAPFDRQRRYIRKILGFIAYRRDVLLRLPGLPPSPIEEAELIEQMRLLEHGLRLQSVPVSPSLPSVNEPHEAEIVLKHIRTDREQERLLALTCESH
jgi:3-deoxy-manno-octulosonate cytidylyltransferase (CMP-KDO synthetase)